MPIAAQHTPKGWQVQVGDKPLQTPRRNPLLVPTQALAEAIAEEWRTGKKFTPAAMPLTAIAYTALDVIPEQHVRMVEAMLAFADTDLLLYRSETKPLRKRQDAGWDPVLAWATKRYGAAPRVTEGVMPITQPKEMLVTLRTTLDALDAFTMAAFSVLTQNLGSLFLGLAVMEGELDADKGFTLSRIDEDYQAEQWGEDSLALGRARALQRDVRAAKQFLVLLA